ncbi:hypothetical protein BLNAU_20624 [Blattamonas nauphoetae]|uniref:Uncharacterized protein n=1 Tax=Blattamonas nauphoetae TaxID=2049346 RepID=A0ABQ9WY87_9EUKA|nr:hypothetical protein BLNAU_20624 [Blattamonas nauphoetae]
MEQHDLSGMAKERLADVSHLSAHMGERSRQKFRVTEVHAGKPGLSAYHMAHTLSLPQALSEGFIPPSWPDPKFERFERFLVPMLDACDLGHLQASE